MKSRINLTRGGALDPGPIPAIERASGNGMTDSALAGPRTTTAPVDAMHDHHAGDRFAPNDVRNAAVPGNRTRIFLVDPHKVVLRGLATMIEGNDALCVCGQACTPGEALRAIGDLRVDLIITGLSFPNTHGVEVVVQLRSSFPQIPLLVFTFRSDCARAAMQAGAQGCVDKAEDWDTLNAAIRCVVSGGVYLSHTAVLGFAGAAPYNGCAQPKPPERVLSRQEMAIFEKMGDGLMPSDIAASLHVSVRTVESYCVRIRDKLGIAGSAALRLRAVNWMRSKPVS